VTARFSSVYSVFTHRCISTCIKYNMSQKVSTYYIDNNMDQYDFIMMDLHRHVSSSHSGKGRSKREARTRTNRPDTCGHNRKTVTKLINNSQKQRVCWTDKQLNGLDPTWYDVITWRWPWPWLVDGLENLQNNPASWRPLGDLWP